MIASQLRFPFLLYLLVYADDLRPYSISRVSLCPLLALCTLLLNHQLSSLRSTNCRIGYLPNSGTAPMRG